MARYTNEGNDPLFRAVVVTWQTVDGQPSEPSTSFYGPYTNKRQASAAITRAEKTATRFTQRNKDLRAAFPGRSETTYSATGHVEKAQIKWERVTS